MSRHARLDAPGTLHHEMVRGIEKRNIVKDRTDHEDFFRRMGELAKGTDIVIYTWTLMSDHALCGVPHKAWWDKNAHFFIRSGDARLPTLMRRLLTGYAIRFHRRHRQHGHLF